MPERHRTGGSVGDINVRLMYLGVAPIRRSGAAEAPADTCPVATLGDYRSA